MVTQVIFKGKPILVITDDERKHRRFAFGVNKAKLIMQNIEAIKEFVKDNADDNQS